MNRTSPLPTSRPDLSRSLPAPKFEGKADHAPAGLEFITAMQDYKRRSGRLFPTWSEVLEVALELGYTKPA